MARTDVSDPKNRLYPMEVFPEVDDDGYLFWVARHPDLRGCLAQGTTPEEAVTSLHEARELYLQSLIEDGLEIPSPRAISSP